MNVITRRQAGSLLAGGVLSGATRFREDPFRLGIASGEPWPDGFVIWTRLQPREDISRSAISVKWQVATDEKMSRVVRSGTAVAVPSAAHSIHVELGSLRPGAWYWYRFQAGGHQSAVGRTRTAPVSNSVPELKLAFASCQKFTDGYYTAYRHMAEEDLDLVLHLGDYIYEKADKPANKPVRHHPSEESDTLERYRQRYAHYKADPDLQRVHALFPWAVVWDDHEVSDNYAGSVPSEDSPEESFPARRSAAYRAYYEHMPLRTAARPNGSGLRLYRTLPWGKIARLHMLDTRQYRSDQPCGDGSKPPCEERSNPAATMFGKAQQEWLFEALSRSESHWNVLAQQVIMAQIDLDPGPGERYMMDKWDGYPVARQRLLDFLQARRPSNPIVLSGDNHNNWVFDLKADFRDERAGALASEFAGTSITSGGDGADINPEYADVFRANPHLKFHNSRRGYVRCSITSRRWRSDFRIVPYVSRPDAPIATGASFVVEAGMPGVSRA